MWKLIIVCTIKLLLWLTDLSASSVHWDRQATRPGSFVVASSFCWLPTKYQSNFVHYVSLQVHIYTHYVRAISNFMRLYFYFSIVCSRQGDSTGELELAQQQLRYKSSQISLDCINSCTNTQNNNFSFFCVSSHLLGRRVDSLSIVPLSPRNPEDLQSGGISRRGHSTAATVTRPGTLIETSHTRRLDSFLLLLWLFCCERQCNFARFHIKFKAESAHDDMARVGGRAVEGWTHFVTLMGGLRDGNDGKI